MRKAIVLAAIGALALSACKKVIEVKPTSPVEFTQCSAPDSLLGDWRSDSVHVITYTDSTDSTLIDRFPSIQYDMKLNCGMDTLFRLRYSNFSGVITNVVESKNYLMSFDALYTLSPLETSSDTAAGERIFTYSSQGFGQMIAVREEVLNEEQKTRTVIFFRKD